MVRFRKGAEIAQVITEEPKKYGFGTRTDILTVKQLLAVLGGGYIDDNCSLDEDCRENFTWCCTCPGYVSSFQVCAAYQSEAEIEFARLYCLEDAECVRSANIY